MIDLSTAVFWAIITILINVLTFLVVLFAKQKNNRSRILGFAYLFLGLWGITQVFNYYPISVEVNVWFVRLGYTFVAFAILFIYLYVKELVEQKSSNSLFILGSILIIVVLTLLPTMVVSIEIHEQKNMVIANNNLYSTTAFIAIVLSYLFLLIRKILLTYRRTTNASLKMSMYLFSISLIITGVFGVVFNFLIPNFFENSSKESPLIGFGGTFVFTFASAYIFSRTRFLSMRSYIINILFFCGLGILPFITFHLVYLLQINLWGSVYQSNALLTGLLISGFFVYVLFTLQRFFSGYFSNYLEMFIRNVDKLRDRYTEILLNSSNYQELFQSLSGLHENILDGVEFMFFVYTGNGLINVGEEERESLIGLLRKYGSNIFHIKEGVVISEFIREIHGEEKRILEMLNQEGVEVVYRLRNKDEIQGYLMYRIKPNLRAYSIREINFIESLVPIVSLSITKIKLYKEQINFNQTLQEKIDKATAELKEKNTQLEETLRKERDMMDILGHELRTPLTIGRNAMKVLKKKYEDSGKIDKKTLDKYLEMADENLSRESNLLETLLSTTKIDNKGIDLHLEKVDLVDVINDSLDAHRPKAKEKGLDLNYTPPKEAFVFADRNRMQEVVDNLIDNAIKYTNEGSVSIEIESQKKMTELKVIDTGVGIPKADLDKLGQKFYRINTYLDSSKESDYKVVRPGGTGLGLYVTFNLVDLMGGEISVDSEVGTGSTFSIQIPTFSGQEIKDEAKRSSSGKTVFEKFEEKKGKMDNK